MGGCHINEVFQAISCIDCCAGVSQDYIQFCRVGVYHPYHRSEPVHGGDRLGNLPISALYIFCVSSCRRASLPIAANIAT